MMNLCKVSVEDQELVVLFVGFDIFGVLDVMDKLGLYGQVLGIMLLVDYIKVVVGLVFMVKYVLVSVLVGIVGDFIDDVVEGDVVVFDNDGCIDCIVWGDIMIQYVGLCGIVGIVIDGVCCDVNKVLGDNYLLFIVGCFMWIGKDCVQVEFVNMMVGIGIVWVVLCDIVVVDVNGVVIVLCGCVCEVVQIVCQIEEVELCICEQIVQGKVLGEVCVVLGYYML